jgi:hypothetical protein
MYTKEYMARGSKWKLSIRGTNLYLASKDDFSSPQVTTIAPGSSTSSALYSLRQFSQNLQKKGL